MTNVDRSRALRVLIVEHTPADADLVLAQLKRSGFAVSADVVTTPDELTARLGAGSYDVVLSDYRLPSWTGMDALARLRQLGHDTPLIIVTGSLGDERAVDCVKQGAADYVTKDHLARLPIAIRRAQEDRAMRHAQRVSEERYRLLFEAVPLPLWVFDLETHRILAVNEAAVRHYGYARDEFLALRIEALRPAEDVPSLHTFLAQRRPELHSAGTWRHQTKDGSIIAVEVTAHELSWDGRAAELVLAHDITERQRAEEVLKDREERFRQVVENIREVFYMVTADYRATLYVSPAFEEVWGRSRDVLYRDPRAFMEAVPLEDRERLGASIARVQAGQDGGSVEFRVIRPDGQVRWVRSRAVPVRDETGAVYRIAGVALDVTEQKEAERAVGERTRVAELGTDIGLTLTHGTTLREMLQGCCEALVRNLDAAFARVWTLNETEQMLELQASAGLYTHLDGPHSRVKVGQYKIGLIASERCPHLTNNVIGDPRVSDQEWARQEGMVAFAGYPLLVQGRLVGVMAMFARHPIAEFAHEALATVADSLALSIERARGEELIRQLTVAVEQNPASVVITDTTGVIKYVNERFTEITGYSPAEALGRTPSLVKSDATPAALHAELWATITSGRIWRGELQNRRKDGTVVWVAASVAPIRNAAGRIVKFVGLQEDITERKNAEQALRLSERRLRSLFETVNLIVLGLDGEGRVEYVNPYFLALTGYARDEVLGQDWVERFLPIAQHQEMRTAFHNLMEHEFHAHYQNPIVTKAGAERAIAWHNTLLRDTQGRCTGTLSIGEDVTEHLQLERQFRQAQKMEAVGQLAGGVAHDFNNLLTAILGSAELVLEDLPADAAQRDDLEEIRKAGLRAAALTRQLLAFSRQQILAPQVLDVNDLVVNMEKMLRRLIGEDIELHTELATDVASVKADPGQLEQVIANLVVNARDAMPRGGRLTITTANVDLDADGASQHVPMQPGAFVLMTVTDTGTGMDEATQSRIFEPFFTTKEKGKGTGLGLATVYGIVKQSGGYVWVESAVDRGATFQIYFPRASEAATLAGADGVPAPTRRGTETVLLVEDDEQVRRLTRRMLEARGHTVLAAGNGVEAIQVLQAHPEPIDLLVTDMIMPGMSGRELAERLATLRPATKVLYLSGYTDDAIVRHGVLDPAVAFLQKPFTADVLARKLREVLEATPSRVPTPGRSS